MYHPSSPGKIFQELGKALFEAVLKTLFFVYPPITWPTKINRKMYFFDQTPLPINILKHI